MNEDQREDIRALMREAARAGLSWHSILALEVCGIDWDNSEWDDVLSAITEVQILTN